MELIDRMALGVGRCDPEVMRERAYAAGWNGLLGILNNAPTIDAVSVVRCHECINHSYIDGEHYCKFWWAACPDDSDFFCKAGQRREADHDKDPSDPV